MNKVITQEQFDFLLAWLDSDRELAGRKYETIRIGLLRLFVSKGFNDAEDLADETINRVITRLPDIRDSYVGEQVRYFHGVARNVLRETRRRREIATEVTPSWVDPLPTTSAEAECLAACLKLLPRPKRELILDYYVYDGHDKIEHHKRMAWALRISGVALRGRAHQIRTNLEICVRQCTRIRNETKPFPLAIVNGGTVL